MPELRSIGEAVRHAIRLEDIDVRTGNFLSSASDRLLSTVGSVLVREAEGKAWLKAASSLTASLADAESTLAQAIAQSPVGTGSFRASTFSSSSGCFANFRIHWPTAFPRRVWIGL